MKKTVRKVVLTVGVISLIGFCLLPLLQWVRLGDDSDDQDATHGALIALNPPLDYGMKVQRFGPVSQGTRFWQLEKKTSRYTVVAKVSLRAKEPLIRLPQIPNLSTLLVGSVGSLTPTNNTANYSTVVSQRPPRIVTHPSQKAVVNGTVFSGFQMEEERSDAFFVIHCARFDVRGLHYDTDAVFRFADKHPDPVKVKIAAAEWRKILSSIR